MTDRNEDERFPEMKDEDWMPSFKEVAASRSWTEHIMMYLATFGALLYFVLSPEEWTDWATALLLDAALAAGYWVVMVNINRHFFRRANRQLLREKRQLTMLEEMLQEEKRIFELDSKTRDNTRQVSTNMPENESCNINMV